MSVGLIITTIGISIVLLACIGVATYLFVDLRNRVRDAESGSLSVQRSLKTQDADLRTRMAALTKKYGALVQPDGSLQLDKGSCVQFKDSKNRICDDASGQGSLALGGRRLCVDDACVDSSQLAKLVGGLSSGNNVHTDPVPPPPPAGPDTDAMTYAELIAYVKGAKYANPPTQHAATVFKLLRECYVGIAVDTEGLVAVLTDTVKSEELAASTGGVSYLNDEASEGVGSVIAGVVVKHMYADTLPSGVFGDMLTTLLDPKTVLKVRLSSSSTPIHYSTLITDPPYPVRAFYLNNRAELEAAVASVYKIAEASPM